MTSSACAAHRRRQTGCPDCCRLAAAYARRRDRAMRAGTWKPRVPGEQVQAHIDRLIAAGASRSGIAAAAGLPVATVKDIGRRKWVQGETAAALLAVEQAEGSTSAGIVPLVGSTRRVQALVAIGWSLAELSRRLGWPTQQLWKVAAGTHPYITPGNKEAISALFEQLCATPGGSVRAVNLAARKGWLPPLAWDDDIDEPAAVADTIGAPADSGDIDEVAVDRALAGERLNLSDAEVMMVLQAGVARGETLSKIAARLGLNSFSAKKLLGGELPPQREKHARIEAELRRSPDASDWVIAALLEVHHTTVRRVRARLAPESVGAA